MTVKLREGIYWSDGVEFTADDLYYTVDLLKKTPGMANQWSVRRAISTIWNSPTEIPLSST